MGSKMMAIILVGWFSTSWALAEDGITATTEDGRKVKLYADGTWRSANAPAASPALKPVSYAKAAGATSTFKTVVDSISVMYDPLVWSLKNSDGSDVTRRSFVHKSGALYAFAITERLPINTETIKKVAVMNAQKAAPDMEVIMEENRVVNGVNVIAMKMKGSMQGLGFVYYGNYYGDKNGAIQLVCYTVDSAFSTYEKDCLNFINGLSVKQNR